jgi:hypothetical protein
MEKKIKYIPKTEHIDGMAEIGGIIPYDSFVVFFAGVIVSILIFRSTLIAPVFGVLAGVGYYWFKKRFNRNFYLTIPYYLGMRTPKGVPPITEKEFME